MSKRFIVCAFLMLVAVGCGGDAEPRSEPLPLAKHCFVAADQVSYNCDGRPDPEGLAFSRDCTLVGPSGVPEVPYNFLCVAKADPGVGTANPEDVP